MELLEKVAECFCGACPDYDDSDRPANCSCDDSKKFKKLLDATFAHFASLTPEEVKEEVTLLICNNCPAVSACSETDYTPLCFDFPSMINQIIAKASAYYEARDTEIIKELQKARENWGHCAELCRQLEKELGVQKTEYEAKIEQVRKEEQLKATQEAMEICVGCDNERMLKIQRALKEGK